MDIHALPYQKIVFVCCNERPPEERCSCGPRGGHEIREKLKALVKERHLNGRVRVSQSGCQDKCEKGPNVMIFPDNVWISATSPEDIERILALLEESVRTGEPIRA